MGIDILEISVLNFRVFSFCNETMHLSMVIPLLTLLGLLQQLQMQKGEHSSLSLWLSCVAFFITSTFALLSASASAQGIMLSAKTVIAIMNAKIFIAAKVWLQYYNIQINVCSNVASIHK